MIYFKTKPIKLKLKGKQVIMSFDVLLLGKDKAVMKMPFLRKYNPKIDWIIKNIRLQDTKNHKM